MARRATVIVVTNEYFAHSARNLIPDFVRPLLTLQPTDLHAKLALAAAKPAPAEAKQTSRVKWPWSHLWPNISRIQPGIRLLTFKVFERPLLTPPPTDFNEKKASKKK